MSHQPRSEDGRSHTAEQPDAPGAPPAPPDAGIVDDAGGDVSERPQADPEVPELGAFDKLRRELPQKDATGF